MIHSQVFTIYANNKIPTQFAIDDHPYFSKTFVNNRGGRGDEWLGLFGANGVFIVISG